MVCSVGAIWNCRSRGVQRINAEICCVAISVFCWHGLGEVLSGGRKVVGISQRRNRDGARFQCVLYRQWRPEEYAHLFVSEAVRDAVLSLDVIEVPREPGDVFVALAAQLG